MKKEEILSNVHKLIATSIRIPHSYQRRSRGFISELKFKEKCKKEKINYLDGGWIIFKGDSLKKFKETSYITISNDKPEKYIEFYKSLSKCPLIKELYFFSILPSDKWNNETIEIRTETINLLRPLFKVFKFNNGKFVNSSEEDFLKFFPVIRKRLFYRTDTKSQRLLDYLNEFKIEELEELYCTRFIIDFLMKGRDFSYAMDFDGIIKENGEFYVVETKEKDPGPSNRESVPKSKWFFGWDTLRMVWYLYLTKTTTLKCYSVILEINNQKERKPIAWKRCELMKLCESINYSNAIVGGVGMGTTKGSTTIAPYDAFERF